MRRTTMPDGVKQFKLTWVDPLNASYTYSKMFDSQVDAVYYIQTLDSKYDYMMFQFVQHTNDGYTWELLPFGSYKSYKYGMIISEYFLGIVIALILTYLIFK